MTRTSTGANRTPILGEFSMYTPKHIAETMAELFDDPKWEGGMGATTIAWCNLWDRVARETGLSEEALMQFMKEGFLLRMEQKRQMGEGDAAPYRETRRSRRHTPCWTQGGIQ
jgi:hypothetical protein